MNTESKCPFCAIADAYPPSDENGRSPVPENPDSEIITPNCHLILNHRDVLAFLDIMPITTGHILVIPRNHRVKLTDLRGHEGAVLGAWLPLVCRAVMKALDRDGGDWNVVQNNGASAAQVVPHVHYHIIPRGDKVADLKARSWTMFGRGQRDDLDDDDGIQLAAMVRSELQRGLEQQRETDPESIKLLIDNRPPVQRNPRSTERLRTNL